MVISSATNHNGKTLSELSESVRNSGKESICIVNKQVKRSFKDVNSKGGITSNVSYYSGSSNRNRDIKNEDNPYIFKKHK